MQSSPHIMSIRLRKYFAGQYPKTQHQNNFLLVPVQTAYFFRAFNDTVEIQKADRLVCVD